MPEFCENEGLVQLPARPRLRQLPEGGHEPVCGQDPQGIDVFFS